MRKMRYFLLMVLAFFFLAAQAQPTLVKKNGSTHFEIDGKPFVMFTGELHNSTSTSESYMQEIGVWKQMKEEDLNLLPKVFHFFEDLTMIPHGSDNEKAISDYCVKFAKDRGLEVPPFYGLALDDESVDMDKILADFEAFIVSIC